MEHYFQARKFPGSPYREVIRAAATPAEAKRLGQSRHLPLRPDWAVVLLMEIRLEARQQASGESPCTTC